MIRTSPEQDQNKPRTSRARTSWARITANRQSIRKDFEYLLEVTLIRKHQDSPAINTERECIAEYLFETAAQQKKWNDGFYAWRNMLKWKRGQDYAISRHLALLSTGPVTLDVYYCPEPTKERIMKPVQIKRYPDYMIQTAAKCGERIEIVLESEQAATAMRFNFYGLRRAIEKEQAEAQFPDFMRATLIVRENRLIISPPENSSDAVALAFAKALAQIPDRIPTQTLMHTPAPPHDPYAAYMAPSNPLVQAQDTAAFEDAIEAWLAAPAPEPADQVGCPTTEPSDEKTP